MTLEADRRHGRQDRRPDRRLRRRSTPTARRRASPRTSAIVEVDPETGKATILRYTAIQDAGRAIHPAYVEGQFQGGAVQGIGWALNEEYIYGADGKMQNAGFLDYRIPVASDLPMIDTVIVEVPNPRHPYGVRGVGETPIVPPMAAIAERHDRCHRPALHVAADVAAEGAGGDRRGEGGRRQEPQAESGVRHSPWRRSP